MNWEKLINRFQKKMQSHQSPVDVKTIWKNIEPEIDILNQQKRRKRYLYLAFFSLGILSLSLLSYGIWVSDLGAPQKSEYTKIPLSSGQKGHAQQQDSPLVQNTEQQTLKKMQKSTPKPSKEKVERITGFENENKRESILPSKVLQERILPKKTVKDFALHETSDTQYLFSTTQKDTLSVDKNKKSLLLSHQEIKDDSTLSSVHSQHLILKEDVNTNPNRLQKMNALLALPIKAFTIAESNLVASKVYLNTIPTLFSPKTSNRFVLGIELIGGTGYVHKKLSSKNNQSDGLFQLRKSTENSLESTQLGLQFTLMHSSGLEISTGIQHTSIAERLDFNDATTETEMIQGISYYRVNLEGELEPIYGMIPLTRTTATQKKIYNQYEMYDVPILLGYQHKVGKWKIGVQTGIFANLSLSTKGQILQSDSTGIDLDANQSTIFKSKLGISYQLGLSVSREILPHLELSFNPVLRYLPNDFTVKEYGVSQKYLLLNGNFRLRYIFGKK